MAGWELCGGQFRRKRGHLKRGALGLWRRWLVSALRRTVLLRWIAGGEFLFGRGNRGSYKFGVTPRDQTAHQIKNVVDLSKRIPKEKSDERKSSQQRIEDDSSASAG